MSSNGEWFSEFVHGDLGIRLRATTDLVCAGVTEAPVITGIRDVPGDGGGHVNLTWTRNSGDTGESGDTRRYKIWRKRRQHPGRLLVSGAHYGGEIRGPYQHGTEGPAWEIVGTVEATGNCIYEFVAPTNCDWAPADTCWTHFCIAAHTGVAGEHFDSPVMSCYSINNAETLSTPHGREEEAPEPGQPYRTGIILGPPEPNPSPDSFTIRFELARREWVEMSVYDICGRKVACLSTGMRQAGSHSINWEPGSAQTGDAPPGVYFVRLVTSDEIRTARLVLIE
jgi:hypothetical protein